MKLYSALLIPSLLLAASAVSVQAAGLGDSCTPPPKGMIAWWTGDGHAKDIEADHDGSLKNGATPDAQGVVSGAFSLTNQDDYIYIKKSAPFNFSHTQSFTIDAWVKAGKKQPDGGVGIISKSRRNKSEGRYALQLRSVKGEIKADFFTTESQGDENNDHLYSTTTINDDSWHFIAVTYDAHTQEKSIYVDGRKENSKRLNLQTDNFHSTGSLVFGKHLTNAANDDTSSDFNGYLDEIEIFGRVLSKGEIALILAAGKHGKCKPKPTENNTIRLN